MKILIITILMFGVNGYCSDWREGIVKRVVDGDTIKIQFDGISITNLSEKDEEDFDESLVAVRLANIDAPELNQPFGNVTKKNLSDLVLNKRVRIIEDSNYGSAGLMRARVWLKTENDKWIDLSKKLVQDGMAWNDKFSNDDELKQLELDARKKKLGLFQKEDPMPPWMYRDIINKVKVKFPSFSSCRIYKMCGQMQNCKEAKFYLKSCGRTDLDPDRDGTPCERGVCANPINFERTFNTENDD